MKRLFFTVNSEDTSIAHNNPQQIFLVVFYHFQNILIPFVDQIEKNILEILNFQYSLSCSLVYTQYRFIRVFPYSSHIM